MLEEKIRQASFVVTISEYSRQFLCNLYNDLVARKIHVVHCGVNPDIFQTKPVERLNDQFTLICIGRLNQKKGHRYLIEACAQLKAQGVNFRCLLVGDGEMRTRLRIKSGNLA
jgi:glycosyltransferase involved in cell wall biosynthesis